MKIEIGESLIYSFLRHEKKCFITQTNWKPSGSWIISEEIKKKVKEEFDRINKHKDFSNIFKSDFKQTIRQAEIDVLGIDQNNIIYAFDIAFHENGLHYGDKIETKNRVFKKLLRTYIILKYYFPNNEHIIAFCAPKVNPATEKHINAYFEILRKDFQKNNTKFYYYSNENFYKKIIKKTIEKIKNEADSSELFARFVKLLSLYGKLNFLNESKKVIEFIAVKGISIPLNKNNSESVQDYVKKIMRLLLNNNLLTKEEIKRLQDKEYCKKIFNLQFPLIREVSKGYKDEAGYARYWSKERFGGKFYVCSQWWKNNQIIYLENLKKWLLSLSDN